MNVQKISSPDNKKRWTGLWLLFAMVIAFMASIAALKASGYSRFEASTFITAKMGTQRPTDLGIAYQPLKIPSGTRELSAWWIPAEKARAAVLIWHGQKEALSDWTHAIRRLHDSNLSVLVFDYAGFGDSSGDPTVEALRQDSAAVAKEFDRLAGGSPRYLMGYSMGAGVMMDHLRQHPFANQGVVLVSAWSSIRDIALASGNLPKPLAWMVPDVYDNGAALAELNSRTLIVHSTSDGRFPVSMAESNHARQPNSQFAITSSPTHSEFLADPKTLNGRGDQFWAAVLEFLR